MSFSLRVAAIVLAECSTLLTFTLFTLTIDFHHGSNSSKPRRIPLRLDLANLQMLEGHRRGSRGSLDLFGSCSPQSRLGSESPVAGGSARRLPGLDQSPRRRGSRSSSVCSEGPSLQRKPSHSPRKKVECICGRAMEYTQNPLGRYPPNAVLYCQQHARCNKKMVVRKDCMCSQLRC